MLKYLPSTLLILLLSFNAYAQTDSPFPIAAFTNNPFNNAEKISKENIYKEEIYSFSTDQKNRLNDSTLVAVIYYNADGQISEKQEFKNNNTQESIVQKNVYNYSADRKLQRVIQRTDVQGRTAKITEIEYDALGREVNKFQYNSDTTDILVRHIEYNSSGQMAEIYSKKNLDSFYLSTKYYYDENKQLSRVDILFPNKTIAESYRIQQDDLNNGLKMQSIYFDIDNKDFLHQQYIYKSNQQLIAKNNISVRLGFDKWHQSQGENFLDNMQRNNLNPAENRVNNADWDKRPSPYVPVSTNQFTKPNTDAILNPPKVVNSSSYIGENYEMVNTEQKSNSEIYIYNNDGTIAETDKYDNDPKQGLSNKRITKHFYTKK